VDPYHKTTGNLAKLAAWSRDSLIYACEHSKRRSVWLLEAVRVEVRLEEAMLALPSGEHLGSGRSGARGMAMQKNQRVADMAGDVLARQAEARAKSTGESFEEALEAALATDAGRQLGELRDGPHRNERAEDWQEDLVRDRARERRREQAEERKRVEQAAAWERFIQEERRELELRKGGQLARLLGEPLPGEPPEALERLASEDRRQAEEGLVALMKTGKVVYVHVDTLSPEEMPARIAANRLRTTWLKERRDGWLARGDRSR
jgi:hypothetical protein